MANDEQRGFATLKYDFGAAGYFAWVAVADWNPDLSGHGENPQEAVDSLRTQCSKHDLWPREDV